ncbi:uncharacterized protein LOC132926281 [Rhopalosiphum padi]|uniref:uncharacterized protein LOC132926281 n=1 Tax=Rhopalosiphum padi TaxID=40932 RepID=UPI00298E7579|nr:uncharacterized protein LOC132926281 [Rhopalosiphum padi]
MNVYASFVFEKDELEYNGTLTHQMITFSKDIDPALVTYMKIEKMTIRELVKAIKKRLCGNFRVYKFMKYEVGTSMLLYAIPTVKVDDTDQGQFKLVSSHEGLKIVLLEALADLKCAYTQISPDFVLTDEDPLKNWSLTATTYSDTQELRVINGLQRIDYCTATLNTVMVHIKNVQLSKILYVIMHTSTAGPNMVRDNRWSRILNSKRVCDTFRMPRTSKTSRKILRDVQLAVSDPKMTPSELWNLAMDYIDGLL